MELGRNVTFGRYVPGTSFTHRMDPRLKLCAWLVLAVGLFLANGFATMLLMAAVLGAITLASDVSVGYLLRGLRPMLPFLVFVYAFQLLFSASLYPGASDVWWAWGPFSISGHGVAQGTVLIIRVVLLYLSVTVLTLTTAVISLVDAMERMASPLRRVGVPTQELAMASALAMRFVPVLVEEAERLIKAQTSRGASMDSGGPVRRLRARLPVLLPLFVGTLTRTRELVDAMHSRCYRGGAGRSRRRVLAITRADWTALAAVVAVVAVLGAVRYTVNPP
jgi:energy-coupling factor transport system permease protein